MPATPAVPIVPAPASGVTVWHSEHACQQIPSEIHKEFQIDDVSRTDSDESESDGLDVQDATSKQVMDINNPSILTMADDIQHFFEKLPNKVVCKECRCCIHLCIFGSFLAGLQ